MTERTPSPAIEALAKPLLRGWLHLVCFFLALPAGAWVILVANSTKARIGAIVYAIGLVSLFGVSGAYHRGRWSPAWRGRMKRLDHATIFVMIAGSYTPLCLVVLRGWSATALLIAAWVGAATGAVLAYRAGRRSEALTNGLYIVMGWSVLLALPQLAAKLAPAELTLIAIGGILFTVGAIALLTHWPDPFPRVLGYHEVWHLLVVAAVVCHLIAISSVVSGNAVA